MYFLKRLPLLLLIFSLFLFPQLLLAQEALPTVEADQPSEPTVHIVSSGESLAYIAELYGTTVEALSIVNRINDPTLIFIGQEIIIPGEIGDEVFTEYAVELGDNLYNLADRFNTTARAIGIPNQLIHPEKLYVTQRLGLISRTGSPLPQQLKGEGHLVKAGETLITIAAQYLHSPQAIAEINHLPYGSYLFPGQKLIIPGEETYQFLPGNWTKISLNYQPIKTGDTVVIFATHRSGQMPNGRFADQPLRFFPWENGFIALLGLDPFTELGLHSLTLKVGSESEWTQLLEIEDGDFGFQQITLPSSLEGLLTPELRAQEDAALFPIFNGSVPTQFWDSPWQRPITQTVVTAGYGAIRSYNSGPYDIFHTGVDYGVSSGTTVLSPAAGQVIFNQTLELRGNTLIIDHGFGVMSAYFHLSESPLDVGRLVIAGQPIAKVGSSGLSTGPHLHWDVRIHGVAVNPSPWIEKQFPVK